MQSPKNKYFYYKIFPMKILSSLQAFLVLGLLHLLRSPKRRLFCAESGLLSPRAQVCADCPTGSSFSACRSHSVRSSEDTSVYRWSQSQPTSSCREKYRSLSRSRGRPLPATTRSPPPKPSSQGEAGVSPRSQLARGMTQPREQEAAMLRTSRTSCSGASTLVRSFKSIAPSCNAKK